MVSHLLPDATAAPLCSVFTKSLGVRPAGTGLSLDRVVVVSLATPWPKPAVGDPHLKAATAALARSVMPSRLFAGEPWGSEYGVELYERNGLAFSAYRWMASTADEVTDVVSVIAEAAHGAHGMAPIDVTVPTFLVCTQGSHDVCCGDMGVALADQIEIERPAYRLRRVSHTGGHRFAPTFLALPSGRMWAYADLALVDRVATNSVTVDDLGMYCRGWLGAPTGFAQVAELAARIEAGNPFLSAPMLSVDQQGDLAHCQVTADGTTTHVGVRRGREIPTIACESPGGQPAKIAREFEWNVGGTERETME